MNGTDRDLRRLTRAGVRLVAIVAITAILWAGWLVGSAVLLPAPAARRRLRYAAMGVWARSLARIVSLRIDVEGPVPEAPFLLVSNHLGYVDIIALSATIGCCYVSRGDVRDWPVVGWLCRSVHVIFVDRSRRADVQRVAAEMEARLAEGEGIVFFPEGTSTDGDHVIPFKPSLFDCAVRARVPVHYCAIRYETDPPDPPAHLAVCWWGDMEFMSHFLGLLQLSHVRARIRFGAAPIAGDDRKELALTMHAAVERAHARP